jgi:hypothetical protein
MQGDNGAWTGPLLARAGVTGGIGYLQQSGVLAHVPMWTTFDVMWVRAGSACTTIPEPAATTTLEVSSANNVSAILAEGGTGLAQSYGSVAYAFVLAADAAKAQVAFDEVGNSLWLDIDDTPQGSSNEALLAHITAQSRSPIPINPGTYTIRLALSSDGLTTVVKSTGVTMSAGQQSTWLLYSDTSAKQHLARCDLADPPAGALVTCAD